MDLENLIGNSKFFGTIIAQIIGCLRLF